MDSNPGDKALGGRGPVARAAVLLAGGTFLSRILGLVRDMMTARYFSNDVRDAFINAFRLPNFFRRIFGEGSFSISFIPVFVGILSGRGSQNESELNTRSRHLVAAIFSILISISMTVSILAIIFMDDIMKILLSGEAYLSVPGKFELTVHLARIMFGFLVLISLYAFFMAILNSLKKFAMTALAPCLFNVAMIAAALITPARAAPENVLAWAVVAGGFLQMAILIPSVIKSGFLPSFTLHWNSPDALRVLKAVAPSLFGMSFMQLTVIVNMHFASKLPSGSQSYLYFADRILELPLSLFVVSVSSALLPTLAKYWAEENKQAMSDTIHHSVRMILFIALPAALGMFVLARPIVSVLFLGNEFKYADALATAQVIQIYSFTVIVAAGVRILAQGFYATQNTWFPALAGAVALCTHLIFAYTMTNTFGLNGLAAATLCSATVNLLMLGTAYSSWVGSLNLKNVGLSFLKFAVCGLAMSVVLLFHDQVLSFFGTRFYMRATVLAAMVSIGALVYMAVARFLKIPEYQESAAMLSAAMKRSLRSQRDDAKS